MTYLETARQSLESIRRRQPEGSSPGEGEAGVGVPTSGEVAGMSLEDFARAGLIVRVESAILERAVLLVSDDVAEAALVGKGLVAYRARELRKLAVLQPAPRTLQYLHELKSIFGGEITEVRAPDGAGELTLNLQGASR